MRYEELLKRFQIKERMRSAAKCECPVCCDNNGSLNIQRTSDKILVFCSNKCKTEDILQKVGLTNDDTYCGFLDYALWYASLGMAVIPLCKRDKYPPMNGWQNLATTNENTIRQWWSNEKHVFDSVNEKGEHKTWQSSPNYNIGFLTGEKSNGITVVDCDFEPEQKIDGIGKVREWENTHEPFPKTWEAATGRDGKHKFFRDITNRPRSQHLYKKDIDFQSGEALIVLPPSIHPNGSRYEWDIAPDEMDIADINDNVVAFLEAGKNQSGESKNKRKTSAARNTRDQVKSGGRTSYLVSMIGILTHARLQPEVIDSMIRGVNARLCDPPIDDKTLEKEVLPAIRRFNSDQFDPDSYFSYESGRKAFLHYKYAQHLAQDRHVKRIFNQMCIWRDDVYQFGDRYFENIIINEIPDLKSCNRVEVLRTLSALIPDNTNVDKCSDFILCDRQMINWKTLEVSDPDPNVVIMNKIPHRYIPDAKCPAIDEALDSWSCNDQNVRALLEEAIGTCLYRDSRLQVSFMLTGDGANGKSTFLNMLKRFLGDENISQLDIAELSDRFSTASLMGKLANIGDDISGEYLQGKQLSVFKKVVTGNGLKAEHKGKDEFSFEPYAKQFFSANNIPKMQTDGFKALKRRLIIIPFDADFSAESGKTDINFEDKLKSDEAMSYLLILAIQGLKRAVSNGFTKCERVSDTLKEYERENNPMIEWYESKDFTGVGMVSLNNLYIDYKQYLYSIGTQDRFIPDKGHFSAKFRSISQLESKRMIVDQKVNGMPQKVRETYFVLNPKSKQTD